MGVFLPGELFLCLCLRVFSEESGLLLQGRIRVKGGNDPLLAFFPSVVVGLCQDGAGEWGWQGCVCTRGRGVLAAHSHSSAGA